jgi:DNA-binding NarL/FixJ family response regulator
MRRDCNDTIFSEPDDILVASACNIKSASFKYALSDMGNLFHVTDFDSLKTRLVQVEPDTLLLDYNLPLLNGVGGISELRRLGPNTNIVVFHDSASDEDEWTMFKEGVRGCCTADIQPSSIKQMVFAVNNGELWVGRKILRRLLERLVETRGLEPAKAMEFPPDIRHLLDQLTRREYEIAVRVAGGESNKQIAYSLDITERTVKAHLTNVFEKLGVSDRLNVALIMSAEQREKLSVSLASARSNPTYVATPAARC